MGILESARNLGIQYNVSFRVIDSISGKVVQEHIGHNAATNSLLTGIGYYLIGNGVLNQGYQMLSAYIPRYISLGTMGLINQEEDSNGLPIGIGSVDYSNVRYNKLTEDQLNILGVSSSSNLISSEHNEILRYIDYMTHCPGYGADGYDEALNNGRTEYGLGPMFADRKSTISKEVLKLGDLNFDGKVDMQDVMLLVDYNCGISTLSDRQRFAADVNRDGVIDCNDMQMIKRCANGEISESKLGTAVYSSGVASTINCELISTSFPRSPISFRDVVPEAESEIAETIDIVFSAMISTGALAQFREPGKDYIFITEAGLWSRPDWTSSADNGLLAGYRIAPSNQDNWDMSIPNNRKLLKNSILKVGMNQVVQVIWKIQLGSVEQLTGMHKLYPSSESRLKWNIV